MELLSNYGAVRLSGGLSVLAHLLGKPGGVGADGGQVRGLYEAGKLDEINQFCRCDVIDTYFVFLRTRVLTGAMTLEEEHDRATAARAWLEDRRGEDAACADYLDRSAGD